MSHTALRMWGWDGKAHVFEMSSDGKINMVFNPMMDNITRSWFFNSKRGRIFVVHGLGTLLINFDPDVGFSLEPGSLNAAPCDGSIDVTDEHPAITVTHGTWQRMQELGVVLHADTDEPSPEDPGDPN